MMNIHRVKNQTLPTLYEFFGSTRLPTVFSQSLMQSNTNQWEELSNTVLSSPWLFPKSRKLFPYLGMHNDLDALLQTMSKRSKKITILGFTSHWQTMIQNNIFTLVRFAQTSNYIVVTSDEVTLYVCIELNLPCYNASSYLLKLQTNVSRAHEGVFYDPYFLALVWYWIPLCLEILRKGFTIMRSDADISYAGKDIWKTYELMIEKMGADLIFMREDPVNTGQFYAAPNDRVISFFDEWIASREVFKVLSEQDALRRLNDKIYMVCDSNVSCSRVKTLSMKNSSDYPFHANNRDQKMAAIFTYVSPFLRFGSICPPEKAINPCNQDLLYVHPICIFKGSVPKIQKLRQLGFWLMSDSCATSMLDVSLRSPEFGNVSVTRCVPLPYVQPAIEKSFLQCNSSEYVAFLP